MEKKPTVLENRKTGEIININKEELPRQIQTGAILKKINGKYFIDKYKTKEVAKRIENKMNNLWE